MAISVKDQAEIWIQLNRSEGEDDYPDEVLEDGLQLCFDARDKPAFAWDVIKEIVGRYSEQDLFSKVDTEAKRVLCTLGAGPLEELLVHHGSSFIAEIESEARRDRRFFWTLGCVWKSGISADVWARVQATTKGFSP